MFHISHLDHVVLRVTDLDATMRFYIDVLGCSVEKIQQDLGLYQLRAGSASPDMSSIVKGRLRRINEKTPSFPMGGIQTGEWSRASSLPPRCGIIAADVCTMPPRQRDVSN